MLAPDPELAEAWMVGRVDDLEVGQVVASVGRAVRGSGRFDRVERLADGAVAEGVDVDLEAEARRDGSRVP